MQNPLQDSGHVCKCLLDLVNWELRLKSQHVGSAFIRITAVRVLGFLGSRNFLLKWLAIFKLHLSVVFAWIDNRHVLFSSGSRLLLHNRFWHILHKRCILTLKWRLRCLFGGDWFSLLLGLLDDWGWGLLLGCWGTFFEHNLSLCCWGSFNFFFFLFTFH